MRIVFDHPVFSVQRYGGISRYFYEIASALKAKRCEIEVFSAAYFNEYLASNPAGLRIAGAYIPSLPYSNGIRRWFNDCLATLLLCPRKDVDILHETYFATRDYCPRSAKRVVTVHDMIHEKYAECFNPKDPTRRAKALAVRRADHVICVSENTRRDLVEILGVLPEKTSVIYHGFSRFKPQPSLGLKRQTRDFLLFVGARGGYKNFNRLLRAYASSASLRAVVDIVCFGGGSFNKAEKRNFEALGIISNIRHVTGDDSVLAGLYRDAHAFVYPSRYEGFGIPLLEAMSLGCPVLCSNASSMPEVVGAAAEMFDPDSEASIVAALEKVLLSEGVRRDLVARGYERVKLFSWEQCADATLAVYAKILGKGIESQVVDQRAC